MENQNKPNLDPAPRALLATIPESVRASFGVNGDNYSDLYCQQLWAANAENARLGKLVRAFANAMFDSISKNRKSTRLIIDTDPDRENLLHQDLFAARMVRFVLVLPQPDDISAGTELRPNYKSRSSGPGLLAAQSLLPWTLGAWDTHLWHASPLEIGMQRLLFIGTIEFDAQRAFNPKPQVFKQGQTKPKPFEFMGQTIKIHTTETPNILNPQLTPVLRLPLQQRLAR